MAAAIYLFSFIFPPFALHGGGKWRDKSSATHQSRSHETMSHLSFADRRERAIRYVELPTYRMEHVKTKVDALSCGKHMYFPNSFHWHSMYFFLVFFEPVGWNKSACFVFNWVLDIPDGRFSSVQEFWSRSCRQHAHPIVIGSIRFEKNLRWWLWLTG